jgi:hypothetical protein
MWCYWLHIFRTRGRRPTWCLLDWSSWNFGKFPSDELLFGSERSCAALKPFTSLQTQRSMQQATCRRTPFVERCSFRAPSHSDSGQRLCARQSLSTHLLHLANVLCLAFLKLRELVAFRAARFDALDCGWEPQEPGLFFVLSCGR